MLRRLLHAVTVILAATSSASLVSGVALAQDVVKVHLPTPGMETMPFLIAQDRGFYQKEGIQFDPRTMKVDIGVMATVGGEVDATQILGLSLRGAIDRGADLRIVMVFNKLPTYSLFVRKPINSYKQLKGQKIASSTNGASSTKILELTLRENGLNPKSDVNIFYVGNTPTIYQSLVSGAVAAAVLTAPFDIDALAQSNLQELPFANEPGVLMAGVAANTKFIYGRPDVAKRFLHATWKGLGYLISNRDDSIKLMAEHLKIDPAVAAKVYDRWIKRFESEGALSPAFIDKVLTFEFGKASPEMARKAFDFSVVKSFSSTN